jgi:hypothetical protein
MERESTVNLRSACIILISNDVALANMLKMGMLEGSMPWRHAGRLSKGKSIYNHTEYRREG